MAAAEGGTKPEKAASESGAKCNNSFLTLQRITEEMKETWRGGGGGKNKRMG